MNILRRLEQYHDEHTLKIKRRIEYLYGMNVKCIVNTKIHEHIGERQQRNQWQYRKKWLLMFNICAHRIVMYEGECVSSWVCEASVCLRECKCECKCVFPLLIVYKWMYAYIFIYTNDFDYDYYAVLAYTIHSSKDFECNAVAKNLVYSLFHSYYESLFYSMLEIWQKSQLHRRTPPADRSSMGCNHGTHAHFCMCASMSFLAVVWKVRRRKRRRNKTDKINT